MSQTPKSGKESPTGEIVIYQTEDGTTKIEVRFVNETVWLTQALMSQLFGTSVPNINIHIRNILTDEELDENSVIKEFLTTAADGKNYRTKYYNLDMIISVGYRIKSTVATQFRIWATQRLREYIIKGFVLDDDRLKNPPVAGSEVPDYFDDLLERIRDIRASERRMYLRIREIFSLAADYQPSLSETTQFFSVIQNKLHFAATGKTAPELILERARHELPEMGLTNHPGRELRKADVRVAKNYLTEAEITELNRIVSMFLDFAEDQARRRKQVFMQDWREKMDEFLKFHDRDVLSNPGKVGHEAAIVHAESEYEIFAANRRTLREAEGEEALNHHLEDEVKKLSTRRKKKNG